MTSKLKLLVATSAVTAAMLGANPAFAAGTTAGDAITNNVTVNYQVGGVAQTAETDSDTFTVDRKLDLTVSEANSAAQSVTPGQTAGAPNPAFLTYTVTNDSNDVVDFELSAAQQTTGAATPFSGTDDFDVTGLLIFVESGATPGYQPAEDTATFIDELAEDTNATVYVVGDIPLGLATGDAAGITLTATIKEGATPSSLGGDYTVSATNTEDGTVNAANIDNVYVNASASDTDNFVISAANVSVVKSSAVLWDPVNGSTNPKSIPGAVIEYCIAVTNATGSATATSVSISDDISALDLSFYATAPVTGPATIPVANGVRSALACDGTGTNADASGLGEAGGIISGNLGDVAAGVTETLLFRATVD
ncbi:hypothetical protein [Parasphingorhabdus sp.]|uniref:hypothetical protein n=1 Tax=Parasphingorhabdus sp. TaxID=2709688 RepID=UPI003BAEEC8B